MEARPAKRPPIRSFEDLEVYQRGIALMRDVHKLVLTLPLTERKRLGDQMSRAARSVPANIAEGYGRNESPREFKRFLTIAMASANEMEVHLRIAIDLALAAERECARLLSEYQVLGKQLRRLIQAWRALDPRPPASSL